MLKLIFACGGKLVTGRGGAGAAALDDDFVAGTAQTNGGDLLRRGFERGEVELLRSLFHGGRGAGNFYLTVEEN